jgi:hypothetical protein
MRDLTEQPIALIRHTSTDLTEYGLSFIAAKHLHHRPESEMELA